MNTNSISRRPFNTKPDMADPVAVSKWCSDLSLQLDDIIGALNNAGGQITGAPGTLVYDSGILAAATQNITAAGLDGTAHGGYTLDIAIEQGANGNVLFGFNGDLANGDYVGGYLQESGGTASASNTNPNILLAFQAAGDFIYGRGDIVFPPSGIPVFLGRFLMFQNGINLVRTFGVKKTATLANLTEFDIRGGIANTIGVNSRVRVFRKN
jgi:hypothetical protein